MLDYALLVKIQNKKLFEETLNKFYFLMMYNYCANPRISFIFFILKTKRGFIT